MQGLALVDFHNFLRRRSTAAEIELTLTEVVDHAVSTFRDIAPDIEELDIRLYGGWLDESGLITPHAQTMLPVLSILRGRRQGIVARPTLATSMLTFPSIRLRGTLRLRAPRRRQKMVDQMMGYDTVFASEDTCVLSAIFTNDDDVVPALMISRLKASGATWWVRNPSDTPRPNDSVLLALGLKIAFGEPNV